MKKYFPWAYFGKLTITLFVTLEIMCISVVLFFRQTINSTSIVQLLLLSLLNIAISLFIAYRFTLPLKKVIFKAMRLANKKLYYQLGGDQLSQDSIYQSEPMEFSELESYLDQIKNKLKNKSVQAAQGYEESKTLMSEIEDAVVSVDQNGEILFFNAAFASQFIDKKALSLSLNSKLKLSLVFRKEELVKLFEEAFINKKAEKVQLPIYTYLNEAERVFSISISPLKDKKTDEVFEILGIFHDISEIKLAERLRTEFVENASHELRTPLTSIIGYLDIIKAELKSGHTQSTLDHLQIVDKGTAKLKSLIDDLLTLSRLENKEPLNLQKLDPQMITEDAISKLTPLALKKNVTLKYSSHNVSAITADAAKIDQVLTNLIENAIKYNRDNGLVEINWSLSQHGKGFQIAVKDNGFGIAPEHQKRLFERFYRVDKARSRDIGGSGLGLAIVKHIMNMHGGTVSVKSDMGLGTEFTCTFP